MQSSYGCLLIHDLGGGVHEVEPLVTPFEKKGFMVVAPKLSGHTGNSRDLKGVAYKEWVFSAEHALMRLVQTCNKIYIVGFGMGGLIGIELAMRFNISALVLVNTPVYSRHIISNIVSGRMNKNTRRYVSPSGPLPLTAMQNFRALLGKIKPVLPKVKIPLMVVQSVDDDIARTQSAQYILSHTGSAVKQPCYYETGGHSILTGDMGECVAQDIIGFTETLEKITL